MANTYFQFKQFTVQQDACAMKVTTDGCLFGAWCAEEIKHLRIDPQYVLDIGTGTGLLSLMIAQKNNLPVDAVEIDEKAAEQAKENIAASPWADRIAIHKGDIVSMDNLKSYDVIISNPPFYETELASGKKEKDTAHHSLALTLQQLLVLIKRHLSVAGHFFLLLPYKRKAEAYELFKKFDLQIYKAVTVCPTEKRPPFRLLIQGGVNKSTTEVTANITIQEDGRYSDVFTHLLQPYYLNL